MSKRAREERIRVAMRGRRPSGMTVSHHPPGEAPTSFSPGDFSLHRATTTKGRGGATTTLGKLIQAGERARFGNSDFARWTHTTLIVSETGDICEAIESGVALDNIAKYRGSDYVIVHVDASTSQRDLACGFARTRVGDSYGIVNFVGLAFQALFGWTLSVHMDGQFICSGLVSRATEKYIEAYPRSPENMMPGDLAYFWGVTSKEPLPALGFVGRLLNLLVTLVDFFRSRKGDPAPDSHSGSPRPAAATPLDTAGIGGPAVGQAPEETAPQDDTRVPPASGSLTHPRRSPPARPRRAVPSNARGNLGATPRLKPAANETPAEARKSASQGQTRGQPQTADSDW